jgi:hypothetical protein
MRCVSRKTEGSCYNPAVILPFDRKRLRERNALDEAEDRADAARRSPPERVEFSLELSELVRDLSLATGASEPADERADLAEKARLYATPLRILAERR